MEYIDIIEAAPLVSIDLVIINTYDEILLGKRINRPAKDTWFVPGGVILKNEPVDCAIKRISFSETGIAVSRNESRLLGVYDHIYEDNYLGRPGINTHYICLAFEYKLKNNLEIKKDSQHSQMKWWEITDLINNPDVHANTKRYFITE